MKENGEERKGGREIIIGREMCYPQGLLLIASLMSLRDVFVVGWIWMQLCRLRGVGISAQQTTAQFDMVFLFFFFPSFQTSSLASPGGPPPVRGGPAVMDWRPPSVKPALWLFNEVEAEFCCSSFFNKKFN